MMIIKSYTDIEQSKKLAEILPIESADMLWEQHGAELYVTIKPWTTIGKSIGCHCVPCWSLAALIDVLPENIHIKNWENYIICIDKDSICYKRKEDGLSQTILHESQSTNLVDACVEMIIKLHALKML